MNILFVPSGSFYRMNPKQYMQRRIQKEMTSISQKHGAQILQETEEIVQIRFKTSLERVVVLEMNQHYPFKPPKMILNGRPVTCCQNSYILAAYQEKYGECPCCSFPWNVHKWGPCLTLEKIIVAYIETERRFFRLHVSMMKRLFFLPDDILGLIAEYL